MNRHRTSLSGEYWAANAGDHRSIDHDPVLSEPESDAHDSPSTTITTVLDQVFSSLLILLQDDLGI